MRMDRNFKVVGTSVNKIDGLSMAAGQAVYVADWPMPKAPLVGAILHSPHAHAIITSIDTSEAEAMPGVHAVLTYKNVPRNVYTTGGQGYPEPSPYDTFILDKKMRYVGDWVAAVAADNAAIAKEAIKAIKVEYDVLPAVLDIRKAKGGPVIHDEPEAHELFPIGFKPEQNVASEAGATMGEVDKLLAESPVMISHEYETHYGQHCPIEPHVSMGYLDERGRLVIVTSTQVPFHARRITARALGIPVKQIRIIKARVGGGFGTKQEVLYEPLVGALVLACKQPVLMELTRAEEFISRTRHPQIVKMSNGARPDGSLTATKMEVLSNTGAYGSHALTVAMNCGSKVLPLYRADAVEFHCETVYTNMPVAGAYRGYGATQSSFAQEMQMDELAEILNMDPIEFRLKNAIRENEGSPVFAALGEGKAGVEQKVTSNGLERCIRQGAEAIGWKDIWRKHITNGTKVRGVGMAALMQGSSIPEVDMASVSIKMNEDGSFNLLAGATDLGTGSDTMLAQTAAEALCCKAEDIIVYSSDTDMTPFDVGAYASSTTYLSGEASRRAATEVARQIKEVAAEMLGVSIDDIELEDSKAFVRDDESRFKTYSDICNNALYSNNQHQIGTIASAISHKSPPPFAAHFAEVEVDTETGEVKVLHYVAATDCGTAINPTLAEGQVEGAVMNGMSYALTEEYLFDKNGRMVNDGFDNYKIFSTADMPKMTTIMVPTYEESGPYGAKSVSEIGINGACPAIANAIYDAIGVRIRSTPFTAEKVLKALKEKKKG